MTTGRSEIIDIAADIKHETERAYLLDAGTGKNGWVSKSLVENNGDGTFAMPEWLAKEKEFI